MAWLSRFSKFGGLPKFFFHSKLLIHFAPNLETVANTFLSLYTCPFTFKRTLVPKRSNPACRHCKSKNTVKKGSRNGQKRYWCNSCLKMFSVDHRVKPKPLWLQYMGGASFRTLGNLSKLSGAQVYKKVVKELNELPENTWLSSTYCNRYCGILIVDGKFVKVKGYKAKIPFIYGIDYLTHDIPVGMLMPSENEEAFMKFFRLLKACNYPLRAVVCDDRSTLGVAVRYHYPKAKVQLCQNHYVENIRQTLHTRIDTKHQRFFNYLYNHIFTQKPTTQELYNRLHQLIKKQAQFDPVRQGIVLDIYRRRKELFQYCSINDCPKDTNLIELYNSHLQARLKSIKGFKSFKAAERWLNAYLVYRRTKRLTDCDQKFKHLNGKNTLQVTLKRGGSYPNIPGLHL